MNTEPKTVDIKTSELSGAALDWAVAKSGGLKTMLWPQVVTVLYPDAPRFVPFKPSTEWAQGGPIIERESMTEHGRLTVQNKSSATQPTELYAASYNGHNWKQTRVMYGVTYLVAAMRCFVASKLGYVVSVPRELVG